jgi:hypothetical protein
MKKHTENSKTHNLALHVQAVTEKSGSVDDLTEQAKLVLASDMPDSHKIAARLVLALLYAPNEQASAVTEAAEAFCESTGVSASSIEVLAVSIPVAMREWTGEHTSFRGANKAFIELTRTLEEAEAAQRKSAA